MLKLITDIENAQLAAKEYFFGVNHIATRPAKNTVSGWTVKFNNGVMEFTATTTINRGEEIMIFCSENYQFGFKGSSGTDGLIYRMVLASLK